MDAAMALNHRYAVIGWGVLFIWWGIVILVDLLTLEMGAIGTGLVLLGINAARARKGIKDFPTRRSNTLVAVISISWGLLDVARQSLAWDWGASLALFLIVVGAVLVGSLMLSSKRGNTSTWG